nr:Uncharacterised protein [Klebsiella pneumoniae]
MIILIETFAKKHAVTLRKLHCSGIQLGDALSLPVNEVCKSNTFSRKP